ncbi:unnamed protein product [Adineta ricciae]|uniref:Uncharacterized protein n=1 Tax=Adineta ricciae TaxID=249248 RepID=A0A814XN67_ADIRI|nr:unnamed protein product [Adineta ricciae]
MFYGSDREVYMRMNSLARQYAFNKLERRFQYNITEIFHMLDFNDSNIDTWTTLCDQLSNGIMSLIGYINIDDFGWISDFCSTYQVPLLSLTNNYNFPKDNFSISLMPDLVPALIALIRRYQILKLVYIYDGSHGAHRLKQLMHVQTLTSTQNLKIFSRFLDDPDDSCDLLQNIEMITNQPSMNSNRKSIGRYIVLDFQTFSTYRLVMDKIKHRGMTTSDYHYILFSLNAEYLDMTYFRYGGVNVTYFTLPSYFDNPTSGAYIQKLKQENLLSIDSLLLADAWEMLLRTVNQMLVASDKIREKLKVYRQGKFYNDLTPGIDCRNPQIQPWSSGNIYLNYLLQTRFQGLTGHIQLSNITGQRVNYTFDVYRVTANDLPSRIGVFQSPNTLQISDNTSYRPRIIYDNRTRIIVTIFDEPFIMLKRNFNDTLTEKTIPRGTILDPSRVEGYCVDLAYAICHEKLRLPYKFLIETKYGSEIEKGVWDGMVGALVNREADLSIASLTINGAREKAVDFSKPFIELGISIMIRKPEKQKPGVFSFMDPLSTEIWLCVILSYLVISIILFIVSRFSSYEWYFENETDTRPRNKFSLQNSLFFSFAAFMHQGVDLLPRSMSGRVVTSAWWFFSLILVSSYTANLAAFLTVEKLVTPIETVEDLSKQTEIRYGTLKGGSTMSFFNKSTIPVFKRMWNYMQQHENDVFVTSNREGIEKVRRSKGKYAFLLESTLNEYVNERLPCDTMRIGENIDAKGYGIGTPLGSDLREAINIAVLELTENGFLASLKQKWYYERSECTNSKSKESKQSTALNLANVAGMFYVLIIGLGSAMVIAFLEFLVKAKLDSNRLNENIREVMRRNLRISITGIDFDEKANSVDYWPLQKQRIRRLSQAATVDRLDRKTTFSKTEETQQTSDTNNLVHRSTPAHASHV